MKYKRIPGALHNFAHSFVSLMNYVDGEYILDLIPGILDHAPEGSIRILFPGGKTEPAGDYPPPFVKSVHYYAANFTRHLRGEGIEPDALRHARIVLEKRAGTWRCLVEALDTRGKEYSIQVASA